MGKKQPRKLPLPRLKLVELTETKMTNTSQSVNGGLASLRNVARFLTLANTLIHRPLGLPGIGVFHGHSGLGKTQASIYAQNKTRALRLEIGDSWTKKKFLQMLLREAGIEPRQRTIADLTEEAIAILADDPHRPLFIDEADKLADKGMLELVREIYEHSQVPIMMIGEELLPEKLEKVERFHNRVLSWVQAETCDHDDARKLADLYCPGLELSDDLIDLTLDRAKGKARLLVVNFNQILAHAQNTGEKVLTAANFDEGFFATGQARRHRVRRAA
jgi:hypothetical protein